MAGTNDSSGARFRVMAAATSDRRRGVSRRSAASTSFSGRPAGAITCTSRCPQSGAADTSSTNRSFRFSSAHRSASARFNARCTCRQSCRVFRSACFPDDHRSDVPPPSAWANSGSTNSTDPFGRRRCFKTLLPAARTRAPGPSAHTCVVTVNLVVVERDGSRPVGRKNYAAAGRLDDIGRCAIGDMVSSEVSSSGCERRRSGRVEPGHYGARRASGQPGQETPCVGAGITSIGRSYRRIS